MEKENWYAMYVRMHHEKKVAEKLGQMGVEHYLPVQEVVRQWSDRRKKLQVVVIPMMIFIRASEQVRLSVMRNIPSVSGCLIDRCTHRPAVIRDEEMQRFRFMLDYSEEAVHFINTPLAPGQKIRVIKGPLAGLDGELTEIDGKSQVMVRIEQLGYASAEMPVGYVEATPEDSPAKKTNSN